MIPKYIREAGSNYQHKRGTNYPVHTSYMSMIKSQIEEAFIAGATSPEAARYAGENGIRWIKASERFPIEGKPESLSGVTFRRVSTKLPISNIWEYRDDFIELENYPIICGEEIRYDDIEWLYEPPPATIASQPE